MVTLPPPLVRLKPPAEPPAPPPAPVPWRVALIRETLDRIAPEIPADRRQSVASEIVRVMHVARKPAPADPEAVAGRPEPAWRRYDDGRRTLEIRQDPLMRFLWRWEDEKEWKAAATVAAALTAARLPARYRKLFVEPV